MIFRRGEGWPRRQAVSSMDAMNIQLEPWPLGVGRGARRPTAVALGFAGEGMEKWRRGEESPRGEPAEEDVDALAVAGR